MTKDKTPEEKGESRRKFLKRGLVGLGTAAGLGYADTQITGAMISTEDAGPAQTPDTTLSTTDQLAQHPTSRSSMIMMPLMTFARTTDMLEPYANGKIPPYFTYKQNAEATKGYAPNETYKTRVPLIDLEFLDPAVGMKSNVPKMAFINPKNRVSFRMIAHHHVPDGSNDFEGMAYYNAKSQTLILAFPGVNPPDVGPAFCAEWGNFSPQPAEVPAFLKDVAEQIKALRIPVKNTVLFGHSVGGDCAVKALDYCMQHKEMADTLGGIPQTILMEDWMAKENAEKCVRESGGHPSLQELESHCTSIRHFPATFTGVAENQPLGKTVAIMSEKRELSPGYIFARQNDHRIIPTVSKLYDGQHDIHENFKGNFTAALTMMTANEAMRHPLISGATLFAAGISAYSLRRTKIAKEAASKAEAEEARRSQDTPAGDRGI